MALITVESMPILSALTRSISRAWLATPRKKLPPPTTMPTSTPIALISAISPVTAATRSASRPKPRSPANASPDSLRTIRLYMPFRVSHRRRTGRLPPSSAAASNPRLPAARKWGSAWAKPSGGRGWIRRQPPIPLPKRLKLQSGVCAASLAPHISPGGNRGAPLLLDHLAFARALRRPAGGAERQLYSHAARRRLRENGPDAARHSRRPDHPAICRQGDGISRGAEPLHLPPHRARRHDRR